MSHVLVKPTSGPEVGESADMSAPFPPGVRETQSLGRVWGRTCRAPRGRGSASAQTQPRLMRLSGTGGTRTLRPDGVVRAAVGDPPASTMSSCSRWIRPPPKCSGFRTARLTF